MTRRICSSDWTTRPASKSLRTLLNREGQRRRTTDLVSANPTAVRRSDALAGRDQATSRPRQSAMPDTGQGQSSSKPRPARTINPLPLGSITFLNRPRAPGACVRDIGARLRLVTTVSRQAWPSVTPASRLASSARRRSASAEAMLSCAPSALACACRSAQCWQVQVAVGADVGTRHLER
jgi:hypothetical protein